MKEVSHFPPISNMSLDFSDFFARLFLAAIVGFFIDSGRDQLKKRETIEMCGKHRRMSRHGEFLERLCFLAVLAFALLFNAVIAQGGAIPERIEIDEKLGQRVPLEAMFLDDMGKQVTLKDLIKGPAILCLVYLSCTHRCPLLLGGIADVIGKAKLEPLKDYSIITVSFDDTDSPKVAHDKKMNYITAVGKPFPEDAWKFLTGDRKDIKGLTDAVGFPFRRENGGFSHPEGLIILSPQGTVTRYLYGKTFSPLDLTLALTEAADGGGGVNADRLLLFSYRYDSRKKGYVFNLPKVFGTVMLLFAFSFLIYLTVTTKKSRGNMKQ
ncbi:MAG: SCO family protein [Thermodesulfovibrionales bacterium]